MRRIGVVLTIALAATLGAVAVDVPPAFALGSVWTGTDAATTTAWSDPGNWGGTAPTAGNDLTFPSGTPKTSTNDFASGTAFGLITFQEDGQSASGNAVQADGISAAVASGGAVAAGLGIVVPSTGTTLTATNANTTLSLSGVVPDMTAGGTLTLAGAGAINLPGIFQNIAPGSNVVKNGAGSVTITQLGSSPAGAHMPWTVNGGSVFMDAPNASLDDFTVNSGGTVGGEGFVHDVTLNAGGTVDAGHAAPADQLAIQGKLDVKSGGNVHVDINGSSASNTYDSYTVDGTVTLAGNLQIADPSYTPAVGDVYTVLAKTSAGAISGTFNGLAQGGVVVVHGTQMAISYTGGDGNDVTLTALAQPNISIADNSKSEGNSGSSNLTFTISLSAASAVDVTGTASTSNGSATTADSDYTALTSAPFTITAGNLSTTVNVPTIGDTKLEPTETFTVTLGSVVGAVVSDGTATGTITNDDTTPVASVGTTSAAEGTGTGGTLSFPVTLSNASASSITVTLGTSNGSAIAPGDYTARTATLTFDPGTTSKTFDVALVGDALDEANETLTVSITGTTNATTGTASAVGTINDDDGPVSVSIGDATVTEGDSGTVTATFTATLSAPSGQTVTVHAATANGTATAPSDYAAIADQLLTFAPSTTSQNVQVTVSGDLHGEANETFTVNLTSVTNATVGDGSGLGTITNDDPCPPGVSGNAHLTCNLYIDLLGRKADAGGLAYFAGRLDAGTSRPDLVAAFVGSTEYRAAFVRRAYLTLLGRPADAGGLQYFVSTLAQPGVRLDSVLTALIASPEYLQTRGGGTTSGFLVAVYHDLLGRTPDSGGAAYYANQINSHVLTRGAVAAIFETSNERNARLIATTDILPGYGTQGFYPAFLRRPPDPGGEANIRTYLNSGGLPEVAIYVLLSSNEYYNLP